MALGQMIQESAPGDLQALHHHFRDPFEHLVAEVMVGFALLEQTAAVEENGFGRLNARACSFQM
jgi:hypothetical protein